MTLFPLAGNVTLKYIKRCACTYICSLYVFVPVVFSRNIALMFIDMIQKKSYLQVFYRTGCRASP